MRTGWALVILLTFGIFILSIPSTLGRLADMPQPDRAWFSAYNLPVQIYIYFTLFLDIITLLGFAIPGFLIFFSKTDDWMAALVSVALITFGITVTNSLGALEFTRPALGKLVLLLRGIGVASTLFVLYLFPDGHFVPKLTRILAVIWLFWLAAYAAIPATTLNLEEAHPLLRFLAYQLFSDPGMIQVMQKNMRAGSLAVVLLVWFGSGILAQNHRIRHYANPAQKQQTKWIVLGITAAFIGAVVYYGLQRLFPVLVQPGGAHLLYEFIGLSLYRAALLLVALSFAISISLYKLWDIDFIINRTLVYSLLTGLLGAGFVLEILGLQYLFSRFTEIDSTIFVVISTVVLMLLTQPLYHRIQRFIDRRFYREQVDFRQAFTSFSKQVRTIIDLPELLDVLVERTTGLLHIAHGAVFLYTPQDHKLILAEQRNIELPTGTDLELDWSDEQVLNKGSVVSRMRHPTFPMLVPLMAPQKMDSLANKGASPSAAAPALLGVLALGPQHSGLSYSRENRDLLLGLADQAGTAIYVAMLMQEKEAEVLRREEAEHNLDLHRSSPLGQAEARAQVLTANPAGAIAALHDLAQAAGGDADAAQMLANLPNALNNLGQSALASLAESYHYLYSSQYTTELLPVGLRNLIARLIDPEASRWENAEQALSIYQRCHMALEANSIPQILELPDDPVPAPPCLSSLAQALLGFQSVVALLHAYERVDSPQDRLAYLASAVERLRHVERSARAELGSADRAIAQSIAESWLAIVTGTISELQARSRLVFQLLTRHTWQVDVVSLALNVRNEGRGAALNVRVSLAPDPAYTLLDSSATVERLAYGEETQVTLRIRPHLEAGKDHFRARFVILYTDPRGPDQVENYADMIHLLAAESDYQFISNPYVVGTPLQTGSPLFFGREDIIAFITENLAALHRNNLVLIGQRRTGKTSLLKQMPAHLGDEYLPVYLDGQALGLDPGLPNFFLSLATEISFALEDRGFEIEPPALQDFTASPAGTFEHAFLDRVRQAIGERHLLLMLDEFEELETAVRRGDLEPSIFGFLRHIIQHTPNLSVIFCGTHRLEELAADYWNVLFNISIYRHIAFLDQTEGLRLVQEPVAAYGMHYDDLALDKIWRITAGHPYFLQLLCHSLVNHHNKVQRSYMTIADVNTALDEILASGEAHFVYLWAESSPLERVTLTAMTRLMPLTGQITPAQIADYLEERGVSFERQNIAEGLHRLALRDILTANTSDDSMGETYRWKLGLLGLWVEKYKSMSRVIDEMRK